MAVDLTTIFGNEIKVYAQPVISVRQYAGFAGAHGLTCMHLGTRGYPIVVTGKIATAGETYAAARANCNAAIAAIEHYLLAGAIDYTFYGTIYYGCVFDSFRLIPDYTGKAFHWTSEGYVTVDFIAYLRGLI